MNEQQGVNFSYLFYYESEYNEIYYTSYGVSFIFIDEDEEEFDLDSILMISIPNTPIAFC